MRETLDASELLRRSSGFSTFYLVDEADVVIDLVRRLWSEEAAVLLQLGELELKREDACGTAEAFVEAARLFRAAGEEKAAENAIAASRAADCSE